MVVSASQGDLAEVDAAVRAIVLEARANERQDAGLSVVGDARDGRYQRIADGHGAARRGTATDIEGPGRVDGVGRRTTLVEDVGARRHRSVGVQDPIQRELIRRGYGDGERSTAGSRDGPTGQCVLDAVLTGELQLCRVEVGRVCGEGVTVALRGDHQRACRSVVGCRRDLRRRSLKAGCDCAGAAVDLKVRRVILVAAARKLNCDRGMFFVGHRNRVVSVRCSIKFVLIVNCIVVAPLYCVTHLKIDDFSIEGRLDIK